MSNVEVGYRVKFSHPSYNDLIQQDNQNRLMYWREIFSVGQFDIGDIAAEEIERNARAGKSVLNDEVHAAVGYFCSKHPRTIRYYYETAVFYPPEIRKEFDVLPFSHFVFARSMGSQWREVLEYATSHPGMSEAALRVKFCGVVVSPEENTPDGIEEGHDGAQEPSQSHREPVLGTPAIQRSAQHDKLAKVHTFSSGLKSFIQIVTESGVDDEVKMRCLDAIKMLERNIPRLIQSMVE